jgi:competence protein ComEC
MSESFAALRLLAWPALAWLAGNAVHLLGTGIWPAGWALALLLGSAFLAATARHRPALLAAAAAVMAFGLAEARAGWRLAERLPAAADGSDLVVVGTVASLPRRTLQATRFEFAVESARLDGSMVSVPGRVLVSWHRGFDGDALLQGPPPEIRAGQRWSLPVRLRPPRGALNPHGFDFELWLFERGIRATGHVRARPGAVAVLLDEAACCIVDRARQRVRDAIDARVTDAGAAGVLAALAVGDQAAIDRADWDLFRDAGVAHLMSISGLHVTMFAWLAGLAAAALWRRSTWLAWRWPVPLAAPVLGLAAAAAYAVFSGWGVPAQRTVWMLAVVVALRVAGVRWPAPAVLLAAAVVVVGIDPWALLQPGFWLSFTAVGLLMASDGAGTGAGPWRWQAAALAALRTQAVATIGLAPLTLVFFQQVSVVGFVANLLAIPLVTLVVTPLALGGIVLPPLWDAGAAGVVLLTRALGFLAALPGAVWTVAAASPWAIAAGLLGALVAVLPWPWRVRWLALPLMLPLLAPPPAHPPAGQFEVTVPDVGQGNAVLVRTRGHLLVYDAGPRWSPESDAGSRVLLPLLRGRGERAVDLLVLSHRDTDHVGGAGPLLAHAGVRALATSLEPGHPLIAGTVPHRPCAAGQQWDWDGVRFEFLHPPPGAPPPARPNALSCVLRVEGPGRSLLLAGDIEAAQEAALVAAHGASLRSDALLVPHHGSRTSSSEAFVAAVSARYALVQAGWRSRFGHPAPDVVQRHEAQGSAVVRTDRCGAWVWPAHAEPLCWREVARRYWHHRED